MKPLIALAMLTLCAATVWADPSRTWTAADGRTLEGTLQELSDDTATIRRSDGQTFPIPIDSLSAADQAFLAQVRADQARAKGFDEGPFAAAICDEWIVFPKEEHGLLFQMFGSKDLKRSKEPVPLFVHLHGAGARANEVEAGKVEIAPQLLANEANRKAFPSVIIVPTCPPDVFWGNLVVELEKLIDTVTDSLPIDRDRIYLSGYSMGARGIGSLLESRPTHYAAALFADGEANPDWAKSVTAAMWLCYSGERDAAKAKITAEALGAAGRVVRFDSYPDHTHNQIHWTLAKTPDVFEWTFAQKRE